MGWGPLSPVRFVNAPQVSGLQSRGSPQVSGLPSRGLFLALLSCPWYPRRAHRNRAIVEFSKEIVKLGQRWERADGEVVTVLKIDDNFAFIDGIWYHYRDGGKSNIHRDYPHLELRRLLLDREETTEALADKTEDDAAPIEDDAAPVEQESEAQEQDIIVASRFSNSVHNYPPLGYAVVYINGLQIEVDFNERELTVQDNSNPHGLLSDF